MVEGSEQVSFWASLVTLLMAVLAIGGWGARAISREAARAEVEKLKVDVEQTKKDVASMQLDVEKRLGEFASNQASFKSDVGYIKTQIEDIKALHERLDSKLDQLVNRAVR